MKENDITYEQGSEITYEQFVEKGTKLEEIVRDLLPGKWKNPVLVALEKDKVQHYNLYANRQYSEKLPNVDKKAWKKSKSMAMIINGYPRGFYNIVQLLYSREDEPNRLTCTSIWWDSGMKEEVYERLFGE